MKSWVKKGLASAALALSLVGCDAPQQNGASAPAAQAAAAQPAAKQEAGAYYVNVDLRQSHFTLDIGQHLKDSWNAVSFALPTAKTRYNQLHAGDNLVDKFRSASFWISGSLGDTKMTVKDIPAVSADADPSACRVQFELRQSHFSLDIGDHIKDASNAVKFDWDVPGNVYQNLKVGDDLIANGFRTGSFVMSGSVGSWHLKVLQKKGACTS